MAMSKWVPESNPAILRRAGKTGEESAELSKVCFRISIQGIDGVDPATGRTNREELMREIADVIAQCGICVEIFDLDRAFIRARIAQKEAQMAEWESMFTNDERKTDHGSL